MTVCDNWEMFEYCFLLLQSFESKQPIKEISLMMVVFFR